MSRTHRWRGAAVATALAASLGVVAVAPTPSGAAVVADTTVYGLTAGGRLVRFDAASPGTIQSNKAITGLASPLVGIDVRPATGQLVGITAAGQIAAIDRSDGSTRVLSTASVPLTGTSFGVDFNPVPDRLRVVSDAGQNLRINVDTGATTIDGPIAYAPTDPNAGAAPNLVGAAYTNNVAGATSTTLYTVDSDLDGLNIQNPPNNGVQLTVGALGADVSDATDLDISPSGVALAVATVGTANQLHSADLTTGSLTPLGTIGNGKLGVVDLAIDAGPAEVVWATTSANQLVTFDRSTPELGTVVGTITGTVGGAAIAAIDVRPATGGLYGLATDGRLYTIDPATAAATQVGTGQVPVNGGRVEIDFNPTVDRIRVVTNTGQNFRVVPDTGAVAFVDGTLTFAPGDANAGRRPRVGGAGYTNSVAGAGTTALYDLDYEADALLLQNPPNNGTLTTVGSLGVDVRSRAAFDIANPTTALAVFDMATTSGSVLHRIDLTTGAASPIGKVRAAGKNLNVTSIAVAPAAL